MATKDISLEGNLNTLVTQIRSGVGDIAKSLEIGKAVILNNSGKPVNFYVYNYIDTVFWVSAMHTLVASGKPGIVSASGKAFKIHPNDNANQEFLVEPGKAYIYNGPGDIDPVSQ